MGVLSGSLFSRFSVSSTRILLIAVTMGAGLVLTGQAFAAGWNVTVRAHRIEALSNSDNWGEQDLFWRVTIKNNSGGGGAESCDTVDDHPDDDNEITPDWACSAAITGDPNTTVAIHVEVWDEDTIGDDELDLSIDHAQSGLEMVFEPRTSKLTIIGDPTWPAGRCALGHLTRSGFGGGGDEPAEIEFSISASPGGAVDGDSDGDGLLDSWEVCGVDGNGDGVADVDLPAMSADPFRKDVFAEIDWMVDASSATPHSHEPWLPALVDAWNEFNLAPVTNPFANGVAKPPGIALHIDTGTLYANSNFDIEGDGTREFSVGPSGNVDVNGDGVVDIGNIGLLGTGTRPGGNVLAEDGLLQPQPVVPPPPPPAPLPTAQQMFAPGSDFATLKAANFAGARDPVFHYVVFGHSYAQVQNGPANSTGLAEPCPPTSGPCNELMVTLGGRARQSVDADRNSVMDGAPLILGPSGLPVDGPIAEHVGTLLHELGHNFGLGHGGGDSFNWKPNYLSIMSYNWQLSGLSYDFNNDGLGDPVGFSLDGDAIPDVRRFQYSTFGSLPAPASLDERTPPPGLNETVPPAPGQVALTQFTCPAIPAVPPVAPVAPVRRADQAMNWNCNANLSETAVSADINNVGLGSGTFEVLPPFDDYGFLANAGLAFVAGGIGKAEKDLLDSTRQRIIEPGGREEFVQRCERPTRIDFEDQPRGEAIVDQYGPGVTFTADDVRSPMIADKSDRNSVPTASEPHSLINRTRGVAAPLEFRFAVPQRFVSTRFGQAGLEPGPRERVRARFEAFDQNDLSMGSIVKPLPLPSDGITGAVTLAAVFPDELIERVVVRYEADAVFASTVQPLPLLEPVEIDDLTYCARLDDRGIVPSFPKPPNFGDLPVHLDIRSEALLRAPGSGEPGNSVTIRNPFSGLGVMVDGVPLSTAGSVTRPEGKVVTLVAPATASVGPFLYWRHSSGASLGNGTNRIDFTMLRNGTLTAVYAGRRLGGEQERGKGDMGKGDMGKGDMGKGDMGRAD